MIYERRYIQFNDLVFDGFDMISDYDGEVSFKGSSVERSFGHGSYHPFKRPYLFVSERSVSMTITLHMRKLPCEYREFYGQFVKTELGKPGKLWAIENGDLIWAYAYVESISPNFSGRQDTLVYNINFVIPGGIFYKANKEATFLVPWDICTMMDCKGYKEVNPCRGDDCCQNCLDDNEEVVDCSCCCEDELTRDMQLCRHQDLDGFYSCYTRYRIVYDCQKAQEFSQNDYVGDKFCVTDICDDSIIAGRLYSETDIPTEDVTIVITGQMVNPWIEINGNTNIITGTYNGTLIVKSNGDIYYQTSDCCPPTLLDPSRWIVPANNTYGWTINPGDNPFVIHLNTCCTGITCVYFQHDPITL